MKRDNDYQGRHVRSGAKPRRRFGCLTRILTFLILIGLLSYPFIEPRMLETEVTSLSSPDLPMDVRQLRVVYLSDIHAGFYFNDHRVEDLVRRVNALNADLILLGGDYAQDSTGAIAFFESAPRFQSRYGVFGVMGNHDRTTPEDNLPKLRSAMRAAGVTPLVNEVASVRIGNSVIHIAGIDDPNNGWPQIETVAAQVRQQDYVIFLSHSPEVVPQALRAHSADGHTNWFDLGLYGHTHGGQIALVGQMLGIAKVESRYEQGWLRENRIDMLISRGVGTSVMPVRFLRRPQIHLITVNAQ